jgi:hypothetical protein
MRNEKTLVSRALRYPHETDYKMREMPYVDPDIRTG